MEIFNELNHIYAIEKNDFEVSGWEEFRNIPGKFLEQSILSLEEHNPEDRPDLPVKYSKNYKCKEICRIFLQIHESTMDWYY